MSEQPKQVGTGRVRAATDPAKALAAHQPHLPPEWTPEELGAVQQVWLGTADPHQQRRALEFVLRVCNNDGARFFPGEDGRRSTDYALGRAMPGELIRTMLMMKITRGGEHG